MIISKNCKCDICGKEYKVEAHEQALSYAGGGVGCSICRECYDKKQMEKMIRKENPTISICDYCRKIEKCDVGKECDVEKCEDYKPFTNRDMLEKKIHEMSDEEFADHIGCKYYEEYVKDTDYQDWLSQPYEEEEKYVVYKWLVFGKVKSYCKCGGNYTEEIKLAQTYTLEEANEKRNGLNKENPTENWCVGEE